MSLRSLQEYREDLARIDGGTVPVAYAREILEAADAALREAEGEYTLAQAMERSGKSRSYFERRVRRWTAEGLARKPGREWLLKAAAIPPRVVHGGFDPSLSADEVADAILGAVRVA